MKRHRFDLGNVNLNSNGAHTLFIEQQPAHFVWPPDIFVTSGFLTILVFRCWVNPVLTKMVAASAYEEARNKRLEQNKKKFQVFASNPQFLVFHIYFLPRKSLIL